MIDTARQIVRSCALTSRNGYVFGAHAAYRHLPGTHYGVKLYKSRDDRDDCFALQYMAFTHGLAPDIMNIFDEVATNKRRLYGFITESVEETAKERFYGRKVETFSLEDYQLWWREHKGPMRELNGALERVGVSTTDVGRNWENVGFLRNRLVAIDFSCERKIVITN